MLCHALIQYYGVYFLIMFPFHKQAKLKQFNYVALLSCGGGTRIREKKIK